MKQDKYFTFSDMPFNAVSGCKQISPGCDNCYAKTWTEKLGNQMKSKKYKAGFDLVVLHPYVIDEFLKKTKNMVNPGLVFIDSMSDLFHKDVPLNHIKAEFDMVKARPNIRFIALTKRSKRLLTLDSKLEWHDNLMLGVSIENRDFLWRMDHLKQTHAKWKCLSLEPLLGPLGELDLSGIDWVIVAGESGRGPKENLRTLDPAWVREIRDQCIAQNVPFTFKQFGGLHKDKGRNILDDRIWIEFPKPFFGPGFTPFIAEADKKYVPVKDGGSLVIPPVASLPIINVINFEVVGDVSNGVARTSIVIEVKKGGDDSCAA